MPQTHLKTDGLAKTGKMKKQQYREGRILGVVILQATIDAEDIIRHSRSTGWLRDSCSQGPLNEFARFILITSQSYQKGMMQV